MTYEQALQIAIEQLDDAVDYIRAMNKGFPRVQKQADELASASEILEAMQLHYEDSNTPVAIDREWVGLTDDEILDALGASYAGQVFFCIARSLEAKLKEKNNG